MKTITRGLLPLCLSLFTTLAAAAPDWFAVVPSADPTLTNAAGQLLDAHGAPLSDRSGEPLVPKCALPQVPGSGAANPFSFFVQPGDPAKLVVMHTGGGACWNATTCASSLGTAPGTYSTAVSETPQSLQHAGGILDGDAPANPFAGWTKVYIPYCTGDVGWGNHDANYAIPTPGGLVPFQIAHRGYANVRAVTQWLDQRMRSTGKPAKVLVAGISAGGYAAIGSLFPAVAAVAGSAAEYSVIGDSANGVVTDGFLQAARANWKLDATVPGYILSALDQGASGLSTRVYTNSAQAHRHARFAQFQNAFDLNQATVLNIMKNPDNPALWQDPAAVTAALQEWTFAMRVNTLATALNPGYRFYTAAGYEHGMLLTIPREAGLGFCSDNFLTESSARSLTGPLALRTWASDMVNRPGKLWQTGAWQNATCAPNCNVPPVCPTP